jgi:hypothetical protein
MSLILSLAGSSLACLLLLLLAVDFCNYQPKWACRFCFHFVGLTTAFFAFYTPIWVGISLASIAVEAVATFQILGKKINPVTKMSRFTRPFGLGVLADQKYIGTLTTLHVLLGTVMNVFKRSHDRTESSVRNRSKFAIFTFRNIKHKQTQDPYNALSNL